MRDQVTAALAVLAGLLVITGCQHKQAIQTKVYGKWTWSRNLFWWVSWRPSQEDVARGEKSFRWGGGLSCVDKSLRRCKNNAQSMENFIS